MIDKPQILLVEDDAVAMRLMVATLNHVFDVTTTAHAADAIELLQSKAFDCVVTDWYMDGGDGGSVISAVRQMPQETRPAIFVVTAGDVGSIGPQARQLGAIGAMHKPCSPALLVAMLAQGLVRHREPKRTAEPKRQPQAPKRATAQLPMPPQGRQTTALRRATGIHKPRLLLVESDAAVAAVLQGFLAQRYSLQVVSSLGQALTELAKQRFDVVVSDWAVGTDTAFALLAEAKACTGEGTPVLIQAGDKSGAIERMALEAGAAAYLQKPLSLTHLGSAVEKALADRKPVALHA